MLELVLKEGDLCLQFVRDLLFCDKGVFELDEITFELVGVLFKGGYQVVLELVFVL